MMQTKTKKIIYQIIEVLLTLLVSALVLMMANNIFKGFYVDSFWVALLTATIISLLNSFVKPVLVFFSMPITVFTLGLFYPIVNVIILKLASLIVGPELFKVEGILIPVINSLFISLMNIILNNLITKPIIRGRV